MEVNCSFVFQKDNAAPKVEGEVERAELNVAKCRETIQSTQSSNTGED